MNKDIFKTHWWKTALNISFYVIAIGLSFYLLPKATKFERKYEIGRPWAYGLVTAPMDFPIYKLESELKVEHDSALVMVEPFLKPCKANSETANFVLPAGIDKHLHKYLNNELNLIYERGVISINDHSSLKEYRSGYCYVLDGNNIAKRTKVADLYTIRTAYGRIVSNLSAFSNRQMKELSSLDFEQILTHSLEIDHDKMAKLHEEAKNSVSPTMGIVQKGEKIIDRGEVVTLSAYKNLRSLEKLSTDISEGKTSQNKFSIIGKLLMILGFFSILYSYFHYFRPEVHRSVRSVLFMLIMCVAMVAVSASILKLTSISIYIVPFAILPIMVRIFFDSRTALFLHLITIMIISMMVEAPYEFLILELSLGCIAVSSLRDLHARSQLASSSMLILATSIALYTAISLATGTSIEELKWSVYIVFIISATLILFAYGLIYIVEKIFGFMSSMSLVELSNVNNPLLMEFSEKCPGTFQHVLQVSNLSVEVAKRIGGNTLLARTGAMYHDIGKMESPMLYTENQAMGVNPLSEFSFDQAAQIIISHVYSGIKIAQKHNLPKPIIDFIAMHHGTTKARYFYNSYRNAFPDSTVDDSLFTYPGPTPSTKEAVIVMMADAIEAASRSLKSYDEENIDRMVENIVEGQMSEGQYKNAPITFLEVEHAKAIFKQKLKTIYHNRISYPELKK